MCGHTHRDGQRTVVLCLSLARLPERVTRPLRVRVVLGVGGRKTVRRSGPRENVPKGSAAHSRGSQAFPFPVHDHAHPTLCYQSPATTRPRIPCLPPKPSEEETKVSTVGAPSSELRPRTGCCACVCGNEGWLVGRNVMGLLVQRVPSKGGERQRKFVGAACSFGYVLLSSLQSKSVRGVMEERKKGKDGTRQRAVSCPSFLFHPPSLILYILFT